MKRWPVLILIFIASVFFFYFKTSDIAVDILDVNSVSLAGVVLNTELADTDVLRARGLSGRKSLTENESMLFVFDQPGKHSFWMKDMNFSIDIIWIDEDLRVVYIKENATPTSYPETFGPDENAKYVLEVVAGFSEKNNLKVGDNAKFSN